MSNCFRFSQSATEPHSCAPRHLQAERSAELFCERHQTTKSPTPWREAKRSKAQQKHLHSKAKQHQQQKQHPAGSGGPLLQKSHPIRKTILGNRWKCFDDTVTTAQNRPELGLATPIKVSPAHKHNRRNCLLKRNKTGRDAHEVAGLHS